MTNAVAADFRTALAARLESVPQMIAARWLVRLEELIPVDPNQIFPGDELLGQMPELIRQIAAFLRAPAEEAIAANALVTAKARELGRLRHAQRASIHQVLREYRILRTVIAEFIEQ